MSAHPHIFNPAAQERILCAGVAVSGRAGVRSVRLPVTSAFTLIELLLVIGIIGIIASIGIPAMKGFGTGNVMTVAQRQLLDDLALARQLALTSKSEVYMVFIGANIVGFDTTAMNAGERAQYTNLVGGQYSAYALYSPRAVGDQPGQANPRYLTEWKHLPEHVFFATNKFDSLSISLYPYSPSSDPPFLTKNLNFPNGNSTTTYPLHYIVFDSKGRLYNPLIPTQQDELIALAAGSAFYQLDPVSGGYRPALVDLQIKPADNYTNHWIRINWVTGRAGVDELTRPRIR